MRLFRYWIPLTVVPFLFLAGGCNDQQRPAGDGSQRPASESTVRNKSRVVTTEVTLPP